MSPTSTNLSADQKRELLAQLLERRARETDSTGPLSHGQRALWFVYQLDPESPAYNIMYAARVRADVDRRALARALQRLVERHAALRTTYGAEAGLPAARVHAQGTLPLETIAAAEWSEAELNQRLSAAADKPFDLETGPVIRAQLFERGPATHVLLITSAHIALDFWSIDLMLDELAALYREEVVGRLADLRPVKVQYGDFVAWQEEMLHGPAGERLWNYWRGQLAGPLPVLDLPTDRPRPAVQTYAGSSRRFDLPDDLTRRLVAVGKAEGATPYMTLLAAFQVLLHRYSRQQDIIVGSSTAGRNRAEWEETVGYFLNVIPFRAKFAPEMTFQELLGQVRQSVLGGLDHQDFPLPTLVERLSPPRDVSRSPIFQVAFNWDRPRKSAVDDKSAAAIASPADVGELGLAPFAIAQQGSAFDLTLVLLHHGDSLSGAWQFNTDLFDEATIGRLNGHFLALLEGIAANPRQKLADLPLVTRAERQMLIEDWNDTAAEYPRELCLHDLFTAQAERTPDKIAAAQGDATACGKQWHGEGRGDATACGKQWHAEGLTYRELDQQSNQLARHLQRQGVGPDVRVGIYVNRSPQMLVGLLGVLKADGAYVPLSPGTPAERLAYMLGESQASVIITESSLAASLPPHEARVVCLDEPSRTDCQSVLQEATDCQSVPRAIAQESSAPLPRASAPGNLAYVIFTSGSTGKPKGVEIEHRSVVNFLKSMERRPGIGPDDRLLAVTTLTFDISVLELFLPLAVGAQVVIATGEVAADGMQLADAIGKCGATVMQATPATWRLLVQAGWKGDSRLKVLCGGEALPRDLANQLVERSGSLWNMYGPTETTIWSSVDRILPGEGPVPIGPPLANTQFYILDERMQPAPVGVPGELYIGGDGLARGYLNRPDLTAERFPANPLQPGGGRIYKTGDLARFRPDGRIEFLGRLDNQVKVRGFRIELGEIEAVLATHPGVRETVVTARQMSQQADDKQLVAYIVPAGGEMPATSDLREMLKEKLPDYMVPAIYVPLPALPLNASGKVDRKALPAPQATRLDLEATYAQPRNDLEAALAEIWASVLGHERVGIHDDFFDLGGASMPSLEIAAQAETSGVKFTPAFLFQHPTIAELAEALAARGDVSLKLLPDATACGKQWHGTALEPELTHPANGHAQPGALPKVAAAGETARGNTVIESFGVYLPPNEVTTDEIIRGCQHRVWFPLERMAGIHARRMSGEGDYSVDLARKAIDECLAYSKYGPDDIDLVVCCNIARGLSPTLVAIEPNTALQLKKLFGFKHAVAFDITNACGGMFTGVAIADAWLASGAIRRALVVSGEYITGITRTAQIEISGFLDPRIACLTVGDAGAAVLLESASGRDVGFHELELYTVSRYNKMCIGRLTEQAHGGPIMHVPDPIKHTSISAEHSVMHAKYMFEKSPWPPEKTQHLIIHQTSRRSLRDGMRAINKAFGKKISHEENTIDNIANRGNTATTTHFVAMWDNILNGRIKSGENTFFAISGSGQVIGTGLYTHDDLPDRLRRHKQGAPAPAKVREQRRPLPRPAGPGVRISSVGTAVNPAGTRADTSVLTTAAAEECIARWGRDRNDIDLVIFAGMTRTDYVSEPAIATFIAGDLKLNDCIQSARDRKTLAFDVYNAGLGFFNACQVAAGMIQGGKSRAALVITSELEINAQHGHADEPLGLLEAGSAFILEAGDGPKQGFGRFVYRYATEHQEARTILGKYKSGRPLSVLHVRPELEDCYLAAVRPAVDELLSQEGLSLDRIKVVLPSQFSASFNTRLAEMLGVPRERIVDLTAGGQDYFTNSLAFSLRQALENKRAQPGDIGLVINVASGVQVGCATYYF